MSSRLRSQPVPLSLIERDQGKPGVRRRCPPLLQRDGAAYRLLLGSADLGPGDQPGQLVSCYVTATRPALTDDEFQLLDAGRADLTLLARACLAVHSIGASYNLISRWLGLPDASAAYRLAWLASDAADPYLLERAADPTNRFSPAHARLLVAFDRRTQLRWAEDVVAGNLSVKRLRERLAQSRGRSTDADIEQYAGQLTAALGTDVQLRRKGTGYSVAIKYTTMPVLLGILERIAMAPEPGAGPCEARWLAIDCVDAGEVDALLGHLTPQE